MGVGGIGVGWAVWSGRGCLIRSRARPVWREQWRGHGKWLTTLSVLPQLREQRLKTILLVVGKGLAAEDERVEHEDTEPVDAHSGRTSLMAHIEERLEQCYAVGCGYNTRVDEL